LNKMAFKSKLKQDVPHGYLRPHNRKSEGLEIGIVSVRTRCTKENKLEKLRYVR
jgi:hypothetical protein